MTEKKPQVDLNVDILLADALLRLTALENQLIKKGLITKDELQEATTSLAEKVTKVIIDKLQNSKDLNDFIASLDGAAKKLTKN